MEAMEEEVQMIQLPEDIEMSECRNIQERAEVMLLAPPEYHSFRTLAADMMDMVSGEDCKISIIEEGDGPLVPLDAEVEIHFAAYREHQTIPFDSSISRNMEGRQRIRLGAGEILPIIDTALSMVRGPSARLLLLAPVRLCKPRARLYPLYNYQDTLFVISLYSVNEMTVPLEQKKTANILDSKAHELPVEKITEPTESCQQFVMGSWARNSEEVPVKRKKVVGTDTATLLRNFEFFDDILPESTVEYHHSQVSSARHVEEIPVKRKMVVETDTATLLKKFEIFDKHLRESKVEYHHSEVSSARHVEEIPVKRLKVVESDTVSVLQNFELFGERRGLTVKYPSQGSLASLFEEIPMKRLKVVKSTSVSLLQNFDYLTEKDIYCKASYYYGKAYQSSGRLEKARKFYYQALAMAPGNPVIRSTLNQLEAYLRKCARYQAFLWERGFDMHRDRKRHHYFDDDWVFEHSIRYIYQDLEEKNEDISLELPKALSHYEAICVRSLVIDFEGLAIREKRVGRNKNFIVVSTRLVRNPQ